MRIRFCLLACALVTGAAVPAHAQQFPNASTLTDAQLAALSAAA